MDCILIKKEELSFSLIVNIQNWLTLQNWLKVEKKKYKIEDTPIQRCWSLCLPTQQSLLQLIILLLGID